MSKLTYHPERGDVVEINFFPAAGREIDKRRPAIILSPSVYCKKTGLCIAVPTSTDLSTGPFWIRMPDGILPRPSMILCDHVKSFDYRERGISQVGKVSKSVVDEIVSVMLNIIDPVYGG